MVNRLDYGDEHYCRVFTRDTTHWLLLSWEAQALDLLIQRKLDKAGCLHLGDEPEAALAAHLRVPLDVVSRALGELLHDTRGTLELRDGVLVDPDYVAKNTAIKSDKQRARESRERRRDAARFGHEPGRDRHEPGRSRHETKPDRSERAETEPDRSVANRADQPPPTQTPVEAPPGPDPAFVSGRDRHAAGRDRHETGGGVTKPSTSAVQRSAEDIKAERSRLARAAARRVFDHWRFMTGHVRSQPDEKRLRIIQARLLGTSGGASFSEQDLKDAVDGLVGSPYHMGENPSRTKYDSISLVFRDAEHVERFRDMFRARPGQLRPGQSKALTAAPAQPKAPVQAPPPDVAARLKSIGGPK